MGHMTKQNGKYLITALAIDCDPDALAIHKKNMPEVPVLNMLMRKWDETLKAIEAALPQKHWHKTWVHCSNSCRQASNTNHLGRDIENARKETDWFIALMMKMKPSIWTLENVPSLFQYYKGKFPTTHIYKMNDYAKGLPQDRKRLWLSSKRLDLVRYEGEKMSTFDALAAKKGWKKGELRWQMGSWGQRKPITKPAYTVTSGQHFMGSETLGGFNVTHIPNSDDRATLQGMPPIKFPVSMAETTRRYHVAAAVPPPFALLVSQEACAYQQQSVQEHKVTKQVLRVEMMGEEAVAAKAAELGIVPAIKTPEHIWVITGV